MIQEKDGVFYLQTAHTSYWFCKTKFGHLEHLYYGPFLNIQPVDGVRYKRTAAVGSSVNYSTEDDLYCMDNLPLEYSTIGRGDYRFMPLEAVMPDGSFTADFVFESFTVTKGTVPMETLPTAWEGKREGAESKRARKENGDAQKEPGREIETLCITMKDTAFDVYLKLYYTVFPDTDVITRRAVLVNEEEGSVQIRRFLSMMVDLPNRNYTMLTLNGGWSKEAHVSVRKLNENLVLNTSTTGSSSNRHNPGIMLGEEGANEDKGLVYGFNLIYSGNHMSASQVSAFGLARVAMGIGDYCFHWTLEKGRTFETPEAVMTCSSHGYNGASHAFHGFVNRHIVRGDWQGKERPILLNNWEATFFDFKESRLLRMASEAKKLGIELFVLDDGWFGERNSDKAGLGDYDVNPKKLPHGIKGLAERIHKMGLKFGLWFEPEMVNEDSKLYRAHPDWAIKNPNRPAVSGRNQLVLDLCREEVQDYIVKHVSHVLDEANVDYVKWDMNRHIAEGWSETLCDRGQGEFYHRYMLGLYRVLARIFRPRPHILLESCSSGGNRFDLGMLCYSPQIWASDDTDPVERLKIQTGLSYFYPPSTMGAHVSESPHQQTLRKTSISTRFAVAAFGCFGYEMDFKYLTAAQKKEVKEQIAFYKKYRRIFQFGEFSRVEYPKENKVIWQAVERGEQHPKEAVAFRAGSQAGGEGSSAARAVSGFYQTLSQAAESYDYLPVKGLDARTCYRISTMPHPLYVRSFGLLTKHILPVELNPEGLIMRTADKHYTLTDCVESYEADGAMLEQGVLLNNQFMGSWYNSETRLLGDFGANLYVIEEKNYEL